LLPEDWLNASAEEGSPHQLSFTNTPINHYRVPSFWSGQNWALGVTVSRRRETDGHGHQFHDYGTWSHRWVRV